jgi:hypothetical protein
MDGVHIPYSDRSKKNEKGGEVAEVTVSTYKIRGRR